MATLFERLQHNMDGRENGFMLLLNDRIKLAYKVRDYFQKTYTDQRYEKKEIVEDGRPMKVNDYPEHYTPFIDQFIKDYYKELFAAAKLRKANQVLAGGVSEFIERKQRTRINTQKPVYTSSPKK